MGLFEMNAYAGPKNIVTKCMTPNGPMPHQYSTGAGTRSDSIRTPLDNLVMAAKNGEQRKFEFYLQFRNTSENQNVTLSEVQSKLITKGYQLTKDPEQANYWIQAKVVYCHKAAEGFTPESIATANFGAGISSGGTAMASANSMGGDRTGRMMPNGMPLGG